ncbi:MAG: hypothetical protein JO134_11695 [Xanthobacteraceae bacterium]|nr:hypothetical protein [Xanthobacteraceae bacterium]
MSSDYASYVVCLVGSSNPEPLAHFLARTDAAGYARNRINTHDVQGAYLFGVATTATGAAFTRVLRGDADLIETVLRGTFQAQTGADMTRAWEQAQQAGTDAIRKFLGYR